MNGKFPARYRVAITGVILSACLVFAAPVSSASLVYQIDAGQVFDTDATAISGFVVWDETLAAITDWHIETNPGYGVHAIATAGATFDAGGASDSMVGGELLQTFYTVTPTASQELEITWDTSPAAASITNNWSIKETWYLNSFPGTHWRTGSASVSLVSSVPVPAAAWLFGAGILGLFGLARKKYSGPG